jgi:hypothetical protein
MSSSQQVPLRTDNLLSLKGAQKKGGNKTEEPNYKDETKRTPYDRHTLFKVDVPFDGLFQIRSRSLGLSFREGRRFFNPLAAILAFEGLIRDLRCAIGALLHGSALGSRFIAKRSMRQAEKSIYRLFSR